MATPAAPNRTGLFLPSSDIRQETACRRIMPPGVSRHAGCMPPGDGAAGATVRIAADIDAAVPRHAAALAAIVLAGYDRPIPGCGLLPRMSMQSGLRNHP
jgi:hypothetical protein